MKDRIAEWFRGAGLSKGRFVSVKDGAKMCVDHDTRYDDPRDVPGQNYGVYANDDDQLVVLDVDYHREGGEDLSPVSLAALGGLPRTLKFQSPHVPDGERGGHRILKLGGDETPAELFERVFGTQNPIPTWGEVIAKNKYVVGAGSQLDDCTKDWCDECSEPDGGRYSVKLEEEIATVEPETLVEALAADEDLTDQRKQNESLSDAATRTSKKDNRRTGSPSTDYDPLAADTVAELLKALPEDQHFDDWVRTGYCVYDWDDSELGKATFERWSETNPKWEDKESQRQIDYIWKEGAENSDDDDDDKRTAGVGSLVHDARENGYHGSVGSGETRKTAKELLVERSERFEAVDDVPDDWFRDDDTPSPDDAPEPGETASWDDVRDLYQLAEDVKEQSVGQARQAAEEQLLNETSFMCVTESDKLWVYNGDSGTYNEHGEPYIGSKLKEELGPFYAVSEKNEIIDRVKEGNRVRRHEVNAKQHDRPLVCVGNGVVDLDTGGLLDHDPEYRFIRGLDVDFPTPENGLDADRDTILEFLDDVTKRTADRDTLLDHLGHGLMPGHPYRAFLVAFGPGGNGKTQVARLFTGFVGEDNAANVEIDELVNDDFATSDLPGKFLNWGDDMSGDGGGTLEELSTLKKASGGSYLRANEKYEKTFNFKNEAALFFSANEPPRLGEVKPSVKDRLYPIDMPYRFVSDPDPDNQMEKQKIQNYAQTLLDDDAAMRGLLELAVEHARRLRDDRGEYSMPENPDERFEIYNQEADPIVRFTRTVVEPAAPDTKIRKDDVYRVYQSVMDAWQERGAGERGFKRQFPRTVTEDVEDARSRALATDDDEKDRVPCWKRVTWTEDALAYMPDWMQDRYSDHFDETPDASASDQGDVADLPLSPSDVSTDHMTDTGRLPAIEATVTGKHTDRYGNPSGHLSGDSGGIDYTAVSLNADELPSGATVRVVNAKLAKNELGALEVEVDPTTEVVTLEAPDTDSDGSDDATAATDGGESPDEDEDHGETEAEDTSGIIDVPDDADDAQANARRIVQLLQVRGPLPEKQIKLQLVEDMDEIPADEFTAALRKAVKKGWVQDTPDGIEKVE